MKSDEIELVKKTNKCPSCGEPILNGNCFITEIKANCITVDCFNCGNVDDIWREELRPKEIIEEELIE